jgi:hypothetical protein
MAISGMSSVAYPASRCLNEMDMKLHPEHPEHRCAHSAKALCQFIPWLESIQAPLLMPSLHGPKFVGSQ